MDENGNTRLADVDGGVEVLPPSGFMIFSVVKKPVDNEEFETDSPQTGDNSNLGLWMILSVLSCCSMIALIVIDKKKKIAK